MAFDLLTTDYSRASGEFPRITYKYRGPISGLASFISGKTPGTTLLGGYITNVSSNVSGYWADVSVVVATTPDLSYLQTNNSTTIKTATKSADLTISNIIEGTDDLHCSREISYYAPETRYVYFKSSLPSSATNTSVAAGSTQIISSRITVVSNDTAHPGTVIFSGANAPAGLVSGLSFSPTDTVTAFMFTNIPGTPWYTCTDVVSKLLIGDSF